MIAHRANLLIRHTQKAANGWQLPETCQSAYHPFSAVSRAFEGW